MTFRTGEHTLILQSTIPDSSRNPKRWQYRATCADGCNWSARDVTGKEAREQHAAHLDAVVREQTEANNAALSGCFCVDVPCVHERTEANNA